MLEALRGSLGAASRVLIPRAEVAREVLPEGLRADGHHVDVLAVYRTSAPDEAGRAALMAAAGEVDAIAFTSSSTVTNVLAAAGRDRLDGPVLASIGPITSETMRAAGLPVHVEAEVASVEGLVGALAAHYEEES